MLHTPEGVRDLYGMEYRKKRKVEELLHQSLALYGYEDIQTPTFEFFDVFSREVGTTPSRELYKFSDKEGNTLVLRPDFTPSIARCAAKYFSEERKPLRFSYMGSAFTNTSNLQGKLKESTQLGAELVGDPSVEADGEMISLVVHSLLDIGCRRFQVSIGDVEFFKGLCAEAGLDEETELELRSCISGKNYFAAEELLQERQVAQPYLGRLLKVADLFGNVCVAPGHCLTGTTQKKALYPLEAAKDMAHNPRSLAAISRLEKLYEVLKLYQVEDYVSFDLGLLSKYKYYTGIVFRAYTFGVGEAVVKGGRYDHLLAQFGKDAPAVGFVMVIDSILEALSRQQVEIPVPEQTREMVYSPENYHACLLEATRWRRQGIPVRLNPEKGEDGYA